MRSSHHTIVALVENKPGVLNKVASKWRQRGFNIESLTVGHSEIAGLSRMTFTVDGTNIDVEQVTKQLFKVVEVVQIQDITHEPVAAREFAMMKIACTPAQRGEILEIAEIFRAKIIDVGQDSLILETTGTEDKVDAIIEILRPYGFRELVRTGRVAMLRGVKSLDEGVSPGNIREYRPGRRVRGVVD